MIREIVTISDLEMLLQEWTDFTKAAVTSLKKENPDPKLLEYKWTLEDAQTLETFLAEATQELAVEKAEILASPDADNKAAFIARQPTLSMAQTMLQTGYAAAGMIDHADSKGGAQGAANMMPGISGQSLKAAAKPVAGQRLFGGRFEEPGILYLTEGAKAVAWRKIHGTHPFSVTRPEAKLAKKARIIIVGDWGTGIERAKKITRMMEESLAEKPDVEHHVVHLGDIYFAGWPSECKERFLDCWPQALPPKLNHWNINGNHDMYCGGDGYFKTILGQKEGEGDPRFAAQKGCSQFMFGNEDWQFIGLDTAYNEWTFEFDNNTKKKLPAAQGQIAWAQSLAAKAPKARRVLLSHHQPLSAYESADKAAALAAEAAPLLQDGKTAAWLWGHEHRCAVYEPKTFPSGGALPFGACLGHGGVPCNPTKQDKTPPFDAVAPRRYVLTDKDGFYEVMWEEYALMGFAVLDIDGPNAEIRLLHERGVTHFTAAI